MVKKIKNLCHLSIQNKSILFNKNIFVDLCRDGDFDGTNNSPLFFCFVAEKKDASNEYVRFDKFNFFQI